MEISIGCDHAGFELKELIKNKLSELGYETTDHGAHSAESVDYPEFAHAVAADISSGKIELGVLICANVRAALCWTPEIAELARWHNDANILALPARFITEEKGIEILEKFIKTNFEGGRHERRVNKINY